MVYTAIKKLVQYGLETGLITETDRIYATNQLLEALKLEAYEEPEDPVETGSLEEILRELLDYACEQGLIEDSIAYRDLFDAKLMNCLMPRPVRGGTDFLEPLSGGRSGGGYQLFL